MSLRALGDDERGQTVESRDLSHPAEMGLVTGDDGDSVVNR